MASSNSFCFKSPLFCIDFSEFQPRPACSAASLSFSSCNRNSSYARSLLSWASLSIYTHHSLAASASQRAAAASSICRIYSAFCSSIIFNSRSTISLCCSHNLKRSSSAAVIHPSSFIQAASSIAAALTSTTLVARRCSYSTLGLVAVASTATVAPSLLRLRPSSSHSGPASMTTFVTRRLCTLVSLLSGRSSKLSTARVARRCPPESTVTTLFTESVETVFTAGGNGNAPSVASSSSSTATTGRRLAGLRFQISSVVSNLICQRPFASIHATAVPYASFKCA